MTRPIALVLALIGPLTVGAAERGVYDSAVQRFATEVVVDGLEQPFAIEFLPNGLIARLAALVPKPRAHLIRFHCASPVSIPSQRLPIGDCQEDKQMRKFARAAPSYRTFLRSSIA